jgi:hypothetical protein
MGSVINIPDPIRADRLARAPSRESRPALDLVDRFVLNLIEVLDIGERPRLSLRPGSRLLVDPVPGEVLVTGADRVDQIVVEPSREREEFTVQEWQRLRVDDLALLVPVEQHERAILLLHRLFDFAVLDREPCEDIGPRIASLVRLDQEDGDLRVRLENGRDLVAQLLRGQLDLEDLADRDLFAGRVMAQEPRSR